MASGKSKVSPMGISKRLHVGGKTQHEPSACTMQRALAGGHACPHFVGKCCKASTPYKGRNGQEWAEHRKDVTALQAPPRSPDLNWIENVWFVVEDKLIRKSCKTITSFKAAIRKAFNEISPHFFIKQVLSMDGRLQKMIEMGCGHIERNVYMFMGSSPNK